VIHTGKNTSTPVGVLFETKKPGSSSEMPTTENLRSKAFNELILYYLRERIKGKNISIKYLVITNIYEWFIFSSADFERLFANNKKLVEMFIDFEEEDFLTQPRIFSTKVLPNLLQMKLFRNFQSLISISGIMKRS
jgi:adenine-specific DNA-methyltransferase